VFCLCPDIPVCPSSIIGKTVIQILTYTELAESFVPKDTRKDGYDISHVPQDLVELTVEMRGGFNYYDARWVGGWNEEIEKRCRDVATGMSQTASNLGTQVPWKPESEELRDHSANIEHAVNAVRLVHKQGTSNYGDLQYNLDRYLQQRFSSIGSDAADTTSGALSQRYSALEGGKRGDGLERAEMNCWLSMAMIAEQEPQGVGSRYHLNDITASTDKGSECGCGISGG
jgi:hypothetical protein